jgi:homeodomain-containing protein
LQTEGKDLPQLDEVTGNPDEQLPRLIEFVQAQAIKLAYSEKIAPAIGLSYGGLIQLLPKMTPAEEFSTLVHVLAHLCGAEIHVAPASGTRVKMVGKWRRRFLEQDVAGLHDELRPGRPRPISDERVAQLVRKTLETKPKDDT